MSSIDKNGPAANSGLQPGDVILAVNGETIDDSSQLPGKIASIRPGDKADLLVWRDGGQRHITVKVGRFNDTQVADNGASAASRGRLGIAVRGLTADEKSQAQVTHGLLVEQVSGPAADAGVQPGDIILSLDGTPISSAAQLSARVKKAGNNVALLVQRDGQQIFIPVDLG